MMFAILVVLGMQSECEVQKEEKEEEKRERVPHSSLSVISDYISNSRHSYTQATNHYYL
jgi:hypothetical protein